jgi:hypothetical protein
MPVHYSSGSGGDFTESLMLKWLARMINKVDYNSSK